PKYDAANADTAEEILRDYTPKMDQPDVKDRIAAAKEWWRKAYVATLDADIAKAIDEGVAWLKSKQQADGTWKYCQCGMKAYAAIDHTAGTTALVLYTLLKCDVPVEDKQVQKGMEYL